MVRSQWKHSCKYNNTGQRKFQVSLLIQPPFIYLLVPTVTAAYITSTQPFVGPLVLLFLDLWHTWFFHELEPSTGRSPIHELNPLQTIYLPCKSSADTCNIYVKMPKKFNNTVVWEILLSKVMNGSTAIIKRFNHPTLL